VRISLNLTWRSYLKLEIMAHNSMPHNIVELSAISVMRDAYGKRHSEAAAWRSAIGDGPSTNMVFL